jgi:hypothetical protein
MPDTVLFPTATSNLSDIIRAGRGEGRHRFLPTGRILPTAVFTE